MTSRRGRRIGRTLLNARQADARRRAIAKLDVQLEEARQRRHLLRYSTPALDAGKPAREVLDLVKAIVEHHTATALELLLLPVRRFRG